MIYLTNRQLALHRCNGGKVEFRRGDGTWREGENPIAYLAPEDIDRPSPYRAAVETFQITVRGEAFEVPEPVREPLEVGQKYWVPCPAYECFFAEYFWHDDAGDHRRLAAGIIHRTAPAAVTHGKALCGVK